MGKKDYENDVKKWWNKYVIFLFKILVSLMLLLWINKIIFN